MVDPGVPDPLLAVRLFTDRYVVRGRIATTKEKLVETLNSSGDFLTVEDVFFDEFHVVEPQNAIASSFAGFNRRRSVSCHSEVAMFAAEPLIEQDLS